VAAVGALSGAIVGCIEQQKEFNQQLSDSITYADNGGISIEGLTDGFSNYFSQISNHYDDILKNTKAFEDNESKISGAAAEVQNLIDKYSVLGDEITESDANTIASNIEIIGNGIKNNLSSFTQNIVDNLKNSFHGLAEQMGIPPPKSAQKMYSAGEVGNMFGVSAQKIGRLSNEHNLKTAEYGEWYRSKSEYSNKEVDTFVYNDKAVERFKAILGTK